MDEPIEPIINRGVRIEGALWAQGYASGVQACKGAWEPLVAKRSVRDSLLMPMLALMPDDESPDAVEFMEEHRRELIESLPDIVAATRAFFHDDEHPLLTAVARPERRVKVGRNDPCPCGSGKKYKRCCGAVA
jgi:uncharacterized protein